MQSLQSEIQRLVDSFVAQVAEVASRAAFEGLQLAIGRTSKRGTAAISSTRGRRTSDDIEATRRELLAFVTKNPGLRIEHINKQLGTRTRALALPIRKMLADGTLKAKGRKRSTAYFPGPKA